MSLTVDYFCDTNDIVLLVVVKVSMGIATLVYGYLTSEMTLILLLWSSPRLPQVCLPFIVRVSCNDPLTQQRILEAVEEPAR